MKKLLHLLSILFILIISSCGDSYIPKPREYFRISFPERQYQNYVTTCPYQFQYPVYAHVVTDLDKNSEPCWINIEFPEYHASIHVSYKQVRSDLDELIEDSRTLAYKHSIKADAIGEEVFTNDSAHVYGLLYIIKGNAASPMQFLVTDSNTHFLRGSLYFNLRPNKDSLAPVIDFLKEDVLHLIETFEWK